MPELNFHGWAHGSRALFVAPVSASDTRIGLWMQEQGATECIGLVLDEASADWLMTFMDAALADQGRANSELLRRLEQSSSSSTTPTPSTTPVRSRRGHG